jgi:hypothetical protein
MTNAPRIPAEIASYLKAERAAYSQGCGGRGWYWVYDTDYPCGGCAQCSALHCLGHALATAGKLAATADLRASCEVALAAYSALRAIGDAIASALSPGKAFQQFIHDAAAAWSEVRKGRWYKVDGKRGNAKKVHGQIGRCMGVYTDQRVSRYGTYSYGTTTKAALKIDGHEKLVYVTIGNLAPVVEPDDARAARQEHEASKAHEAAVQAARPAFPAHLAGKSGATGRIIAGPFTGKTGKVFWHGVKAGGARVGVKLCACSRRCSCQVAWCSAHDVVPAAQAAIR